MLTDSTRILGIISTAAGRYTRLRGTRPMTNTTKTPAKTPAKTWFITGASRGIGAEIVRAALDAGDRVVATGRDAQAIARRFEADLDRVLPLQLDVTSVADAIVAVEAAVARFGRIDVLVN